MKHLFIINPNAGGKKARKEETEREIRAFTDSTSDPCEIYQTKGPMDACRKVAEESEAADMLYVYACGGDGTLNECVNGAALRGNVAVTQYPCGTGNDFLRMFGLNDIGKFHDFKALSGGIVRPLDIIDCNGRYGINICSVGIDARVGTDVHKYSRIPIVGGKTGYIVALLVNVIKGVAQKYRITFEDETIEKKTTLVCACNGRFYGGGFNPVPEAMPDDGVLEYLIVDAVSRLKVAQIVGKYSKGRFRELSDVIKHFRGSLLELECEHDVIVNIDGEALFAKKVVFSVVPKGVNFLFPRNLAFFDSEK